MADRGATQGWLSAATRAALTEVGGIESRTVRLGAVNGPELEGPRLPRGPPDEAVSARPLPQPVPEQLTVRVEAGRSPAAETDLVVNIIKHDRLTGQGPLLCISGLYRWLGGPGQTDHAMTQAVDNAMQAVALQTGVCKHDMVFYRPAAIVGGQLRSMADAEMYASVSVMLLVLQYCRPDVRRLGVRYH
jgi:hypothetical protein